MCFNNSLLEEVKARHRTEDSRGDLQYISLSVNSLGMEAREVSRWKTKFCIYGPTVKKKIKLVVREEGMVKEQCLYF